MARVGKVVLGAALAAVLTLTALGATPASAEVANPTAPVAAPDTPEGWSPYLPQVSCDPVAKPGTLALRAMLMSAYGGRDLGITRACDIGARSEHKEGRAWDWGLDASDPAEKAVATQFLDWLLAPGPKGTSGYEARRLGVMYVIYDGRIWSSYRADEGWRAYSGGESHGDHLHISQAWTGAMKRSSWWTGKAAAVDYGPCIEVEGVDAAPWSAPRSTPCPTPISAMSLTGTPVLAKESTGPYVVQLQRLLSVSPVTGFFGPITEAAVLALQKAKGLSQTGTTTESTWKALRAGTSSGGTTAPPPPTSDPAISARALPSRMTYRVVEGDSLSRIASRWRSTVDGIRSASSLESDVLQVGQVLTLPVRSTLTRFTYKALRKGDKNGAVQALQTAMRMRPKYRTGVFGDITARNVNGLKARHGWPADGKVGIGVWRALGA